MEAKSFKLEEIERPMEVVNWMLEDIKPDPSNPRIIPEEAIAAVVHSIKRFKVVQPIVVDRHGTIVIGHTRRIAARRLGMETFPVIVKDDLSDDDLKKLAIAENRTHE